MKWIDLVVNAGLGVLGECRDTSADLVKIRLAGYYLEFVKVLRQQNLLSVLAMAGTLMAVNLLMILEVSILLYGPFDPIRKILLAFAVGLVGLGAVFFMILEFFSEARWMRLTGADQLVADAVKSRTRSEN